MKLIKFVLVACSLMSAFSAYATMTDEDYMTYTGAVRSGDVKVVKKFLDAGTANVNEKFFAWEALQMAAEANKMDVIKVLVEHGADLNYQHPLTKWTAFHHAAYNGNKEMMEYLKAKGADINKKIRGDVSFIRLMRDEGRTDMVDYLTKLGVLDDGCQEEKCLN